MVQSQYNVVGMFTQGADEMLHLARPLQRESQYSGQHTCLGETARVPKDTTNLIHSVWSPA